MFERLVLLLLFLLPWQTRYIFGQVELESGQTEYGIISVYAIELFILVLFFVGQRLNLAAEYRRTVRVLGLVLVVTLASVLLAVEKELAFFQWLHLVFAALLFLILLDRRVNPRRALRVFLLGLIVPIGLGLFQFFFGFSPAASWLGLASHEAAELGASVIEGSSGRWLRAYGSFGHPNVFGGYLAVGLFGLLFLFSSAKLSTTYQSLRLRFLKLIALSAVPVFSFTLLTTFSRSAVLGFLIAILVSSGLLLWHGRARAVVVLPLLILVILTVGLSVTLLGEPLLARFSPELRLEQRSLIERQAEYQIFPRVFLSSPTSPLIGLGFGNYVFTLSSIIPGRLPWAYQPIHNSVLLALSEVGLIGVLVLAYWVSLIDRKNYAAVAAGSSRAIAALGLGTIILIVAFFDHYLWSSWSGLALAAFVLALTVRFSETP